VGRASASSPVQRDIHREVMVAFNTSWSFSASKVNAKSIVRICTLCLFYALAIGYYLCSGLTVIIIIVFPFKSICQ
jgi:hypothetical protein